MSVYIPITSGKYNDILFDEFSKLSVSLREALLLIGSNPDTVGVFLQSVRDYDENLKSNIVNPTNLFNSINEIFLNALIVGETTKDSFDFAANMFGFILNIPFPITTIQRQSVAIDIALVCQSVAIFALVNAMTTIVGVTFASSESIISFLNLISSQFDKVLKQNRFKLISNDLIELVTIFPDISEMVGNTVKFLQQSEIALPKEQIVSVSRSGLIPLTYQYFGNINLRNTLSSINNLQTPFNITGDFKVLAQ